MKQAQVVFVAGLLAFGWSVQVGAASLPDAASPNPAEVVAVRQAGMNMAAVTLGGIRGAFDRGAPAKTQSFAAQGLARWAAALPSLFAENTRDAAPSLAKSEIWSDSAGFSAKAADFITATDALLAAAKADDRDAMAIQIEAVKQACVACHDAYQLPRTSN